MPDDSSGHRLTTLHFRFFCLLWGFGHLFHMLSIKQWEQSTLDLAVTVFCVLLICTRRLSVLLVLAALQVIEVFDGLPFGSNHWVFTAFVNLAVLLGWLLTLRRGDSFRIFASGIRWSLVVLYFFVVFHKLNWDFFSTDLSCGAFFYTRVTDRFPFLPTGEIAQIVNIYLTLIVEAAIPILFFTRWRHLGVLLGLVFHTGITLTGYYYDFSSMLFGVFVLFVDSRLLERVLEKGRGGLFRTCGLLGLPVIVVISVLGEISFKDFAYLFWILYALSCTALFLMVLIENRAFIKADDAFLFSFPKPNIAVIPVLVFLNGFSPYLGLKTEQSFAMFSNLATEGDKHNHLIVPRWLKIFRYQDDLVQVVKSNTLELDLYARTRSLVPFTQFRNVASFYPQASVIYIRGGKRFEVKEIGEDSVLGKPVPLLTRKFMKFRPVDPGTRQRCWH